MADCYTLQYTTNIWQVLKNSDQWNTEIILPNKIIQIQFKLFFEKNLIFRVVLMENITMGM